MSVFIEGLGLGGFRSFGELQHLGPLSKINVIAGQNNSGKSNVLIFLERHFRNITTKKTHAGQWGTSKFDQLDVHRGKDAPFAFALGRRIGGDDFKSLLDGLGRRGPRDSELFRRFLTSDFMTGGSSVSWFRFAALRLGDQLAPLDIQILKDGLTISPEEVAFLWQRLTNKPGGSLETWLPDLMLQLTPQPQNVPITLIPTIRHVRDAEDHPGDDFSGLGIVKRLARLESPRHSELADRARFDAVNGFVRTVLDDSGAKLSISYDHRQIIVDLRGRVLPLESLGTGIHQVVMFAAAATILQNQIVCIEEPEIHLHPILQRKLLRYLAEKTSNQYFITTHSAHLLDAPGASIFHIRLEDGQSVVAGAFEPNDKAAIAVDLGYRASDLLQANSIIWVEGPSDRIYLNWWLQAHAGDLVEGLHYSVMFYGGRLLSHLTAEDPDVNEFISLRRLNRNIAILIDSDMENEQDQINETKARVCKELGRSPGLAWVTKGRTIENYVPLSILDAATRLVHRSAVERANPGGEFDMPLAYTNEHGSRVKIDKVGISKRVSEQTAQFDVLDLRERLRQLADFIRAANAT